MCCSCGCSRWAGPLPGPQPVGKDGSVRGGGCPCTEVDGAHARAATPCGEGLVRRASSCTYHHHIHPLAVAASFKLTFSRSATAFTGWPGVLSGEQRRRKQPRQDRRVRREHAVIASPSGSNSLPRAGQSLFRPMPPPVAYA